MKTALPMLFQATTRCRCNISLSVVLWPPVESRASSGLRSGSRSKPAESVTRMPRGGRGVNVTGEDACLKAIYDWLDKGHTRYDDAEVRLDRGY